MARSTVSPGGLPTAPAGPAATPSLGAGIVAAVTFGGTNYHRVRDAIREEIIAGVFAQGEWLKLSVLAERYGLSAAPIREALNQLEGEGLVEMLPNRGARVRSVTREFVADLFEIRVALEPMMAERSAAVATEDHVRQLEEIEDRLEQVFVDGTTWDMIRANQIFHRALHNIRPNQPAIDLLRQHSALVSSVRRHYGFPPQRHASIVAEHRRLIEACRTRDGKAAYRIMRLHVQHSIDELLPRIPAT